MFTLGLFGLETFQGLALGLEFGLGQGGRLLLAPSLGQGGLTLLRLQPGLFLLPSGLFGLLPLQGLALRRLQLGLLLQSSGLFDLLPLQGLAFRLESGLGLGNLPLVTLRLRLGCQA